MIYHVLTESEPLSARQGGALAHTVANLMKLDPSRAAVCSGFDDSWGLDPSRIIAIPKLDLFGRLRARRFYPLAITGTILRRMFREFTAILKPGDIVWCHNRPVFAAALADQIHAKGSKLVCHFHDGIDPTVALRCLSQCSPDAAIFVSEYLRGYWVQYLPSLQNTHVVHNGADVTQFYPPTEKPNYRYKVPVILFVGRLNPIKGAHVLVDAVRKLNERGVHTICRMVGSSFSGGSTRTPYIEDIIHSSPENVEFPGHCPATDLGNIYRAADVLCCPSVWQEPFGKVNVEAMACGLPVVASGVGGIPEIAAHGGVKLVQPGNAEELADALQAILCDSGLRHKMSLDAHASFIKHFTWTVALARYREITAAL